LIATRKAPTTWKHSKGKGCTILGMPSTLEDTISSASAVTFVIAYVIAFL